MLLLDCEAIFCGVDGVYVEVFLVLLVFVVFCLFWFWMGTLPSLVVLGVIVWFEVFVMCVGPGVLFG